jgi:hypothetical protein
MTADARRAAYGKGGLYKRFVFEKDEAGKILLDRRGNEVVKYEYWQATFEIPARVKQKNAQTMFRDTRST